MAYNYAIGFFGFDNKEVQEIAGKLGLEQKKTGLVGFFGGNQSAKKCYYSNGFGSPKARQPKFRAHVYVVNGHYMDAKFRDRTSEDIAREVNEIQGNNSDAEVYVLYAKRNEVRRFNPNNKSIVTLTAEEGGERPFDYAVAAMYAKIPGTAVAGELLMYKPKYEQTAETGNGKDTAQLGPETGQDLEKIVVADKPSNVSIRDTQTGTEEVAPVEGKPRKQLTEGDLPTPSEIGIPTMPPVDYGGAKEEEEDSEDAPDSSGSYKEVITGEDVDSAVGVITGSFMPVGVPNTPFARRKKKGNGSGK